jgi:REP element-mobilizing transposase RayT
MRSDPHSRNLRLHRLNDTPATFFITKSLRPEKAVLDEAAREIIVSAFAFAVRQQRIYLRAFVVMPDHWHALFALRDPWTLPKFMHHTMSYVGRKTSVLLGKLQNIVAGRLLRHLREDREAVPVCHLLHRTKPRRERTGRKT